MHEVSNHKNLILVEGENDYHLVREIWRYHSDMQDTPFAIENKKGVDNLLQSINAELKVDGREVLGIMLDANSALSDRWEKILNHLEDFTDVQLPEKPEKSGTIINSEPKVGIWLMPDNESPGELENFIRTLIPTGNPIWSQAVNYIDGIPNFRHKKCKAKVHAWLATCKRPGLLAPAIRNDELDLRTPLAKDFHKWLSELFAPP